MSVKVSPLYGRIVLSVMCFTLPVLGFATLVMAQSEPAESRNWWTPAADGTREGGKLAELLNRKKVYVVTSFTDSRTIDAPSPTRTGDVHRTVLDAFAVHKEFQVVPGPSQADFAVIVRSTATTEAGDRPPNFSLFGSQYVNCRRCHRTGSRVEAARRDESSSSGLGIVCFQCAGRSPVCSTLYSRWIPLGIIEVKGEDGHQAKVTLDGCVATRCRFAFEVL